jgi:hypothetical protein
MMGGLQRKINLALNGTNHLKKHYKKGVGKQHYLKASNLASFVPRWVHFALSLLAGSCW